jgi:hypothetical protein
LQDSHASRSAKDCGDGEEHRPRLFQFI